MIAWQTAYFPDTAPESTRTRWQDALIACGYAPFDPFGERFIRPAPQNIRLFLLPTQNGIGRAAVGDGDGEMLRVVSLAFPIVWLTLAGDTTSLQIYQDGEIIDGDLEMAATLFPPTAESATLPLSGLPTMKIGGLPDDLIPESVRGKTDSVNTRQADSMIGRWMNTLNKREGMNANDAANARELLAARPQWDSADGQRIAAWVMRLGLPHPATTPDYVTVRDAYALYRRRQRQPDAPLYPGDAETLIAMPSPETCISLFGGKA